MSLGNPDGMATAASSFTAPDPLPDDEDPEDDLDDPDEDDADELPPHAAEATSASANAVASNDRNTGFISINTSA